jgi:putative transposase
MFKKNGAFESNETNTVNIKCSLDIPASKEELLNQYFGHSRFIYNYCVNYNKELYKNEKRSLSYVELQNLLPELKKDEETSFLKEVDSTSLQQAIQDYCIAMKNFLKKKGGYPSFRNRHQNQTVRIVNVKQKNANNNSIRIDGNKIKLGKFGWVKTKPNQKIPNGDIQSVTIKRTKFGKVYATLTIRRAEPIVQFEKTGKEVGIDVGISNFATFSDGTIIHKPDFILKDEKKKKKLYRQVSRKKLGSKNREKAVQKLAKFCEKDANRREDFTHKLALDIVQNYDFIAVEHLDIKKMLTDTSTAYSKQLHKEIGELGWYSFISKIEYKSKWYGKYFVKVDTFYPSSQLCSNCGYKNTEVKNLAVRNWTCPICNCNHNRDYNASVNILNEGKRLLTI